MKNSDLYKIFTVGFMLFIFEVTFAADDILKKDFFSEGKAAVLDDKILDDTKDVKRGSEIDLDKINSVGSKQDECFEAIETSLTCLDEQLQHLTAEVKTLRKHIDRMKFITKNQVHSKEVNVFENKEDKPVMDNVLKLPLTEKITIKDDIAKIDDKNSEQPKSEEH